MGDQIEITTWPKHSNLFYKVTSNALSIEIKAAGNAAIGFATKPGKTCEFWVVIGEHNHCSWIMKKGDNEKRQIDTLNIVSSEEYRKFWITWCSNRLQWGRAEDTKPLLMDHLLSTGVQYFTLSVLGERNPIHWKFEIPPLRITKPPKPLSSGEIKWVPIDNQLPDDSLIGGLEKECLYIIRAEHRLSLTPGKFVPSKGVAYISWGGEAVEKSEIEVLCGYNGMWVPVTGNRIPAGAIVGGYSEDSAERLFVGRAQHDDHLILGKVQLSHKCCYIPYKGQEISKKQYEVLVNPNVYHQNIYKMSIPDLNVHNAGDLYEQEEEDEYDINILYRMPRAHRQ